MSGKGLGINAHDVGIGATLNQNLLMVPPNQRSYAWEVSHVQTLFEDLSGAISTSGAPYFLGTVVLTQGSGDRMEVARYEDGWSSGNAEGYNEFIWHKPTHWMPLPPPPAATQGQEG